MKIPDKIRLGGVDWNIVLVDGLNDGVHMLEGRINYRKSLIELNASQEHQQACISLLHEIGHYILDVLMMRSTDEEKQMPDEEKLVQGFALGFYQILQDNGWALFDLAEPEEDQTN